MLSVDEALANVLKQAERLPLTKVSLTDALGSVLGEDITSDADSPPHDKSIVDGYALRAVDVAAGKIELDVIEEVVAGQVPQCTLGQGQATRIMTGAPIPAGADAVVMLERTTLIPAESPSSSVATVRVESEPIKPGQNIMRRGVSMRRGDVVLSAGSVIRPIEIGVLAETGHNTVTVIRKPTVSILATGNELVSAEQTPTAGQIRNSNGPMLAALVERCAGTPVNLGIGRDDEAHLRALVTQGLEADVLLLSGGVSAGILDLAPKVFAEVGIEQIFHKVSLKPGKPLWFGVKNGPLHRTLVFGLPGNPVSSLVCFELFVCPTLGQLMGRTDLGLSREAIPLASEFSHRGDRPTYHPARIANGAIEPLSWRGSGDLRTLVDATALAHFPAGDRDYRAGEPIEVLCNM